MRNAESHRVWLPGSQYPDAVLLVGAADKRRCEVRCLAVRYVNWQGLFTNAYRGQDSNGSGMQGMPCLPSTVAYMRALWAMRTIQGSLCCKDLSCLLIGQLPLLQQHRHAGSCTYDIETSPALPGAHKPDCAFQGAMEGRAWATPELWTGSNSEDVQTSTWGALAPAQRTNNKCVGLCRQQKLQ